MAAQSRKPRKSYNVLLLGDSGVGKSCLIHQFCFGEYSVKFPTVGSDYKVRCIEKAGKTMRIVFIDTAGQERFDSIQPNLCRKADTFVLVYDISDQSTFERLTMWLNHLNEYRRPNPDNLNIILIGNKADSRTRAVSYEAGMQFARKNQMLFFETSALTGNNINDAFDHLVNELTKLAKFRESVDTKENPQNIVTLSQTTNARRTKSCCSSATSASQRSSADARNDRDRHLTSSHQARLSISTSGDNVDLSVHEIPTLLSIDNLDLARRSVRSLSDWFDVGLELGLHYSTLTDIDKEDKSDNDLTREMLAAWLKKKDQVGARGGPTWKQLANALEQYGYTDLRKSVLELIES